MSLTRSFSNRPRPVAIAASLAVVAFLPLQAGAADPYEGEAPLFPVTILSTVTPDTDQHLQEALRGGRQGCTTPPDDTDGT